MDPNLLLAPLGDGQDFRDLLLRKIASVRVQRDSAGSTPRGTSPDLREERDLLTDMVTKAQKLVKTLQTQLESEKLDKEQKLRALQKKYESEVAALREEIKAKHSFGDRTARELRDNLQAEIRTREAQMIENEERLRSEVSRLQSELSTARHQLASTQRELSTERLLKPQGLDQQLLIKQLQVQVAALTNQLKEQLPEDKEADAERKIAELTAEKRKSERTLEMMLKLSSEKEAELTEEAERLRVLNNSFMEFTNKSEEWVKTGLEGLAIKLDHLSLAFGGVSPTLESAVASCSAVVQETKERLLHFLESELTGRSLKLEVLATLDKLQRYCQGVIDRFGAPAPKFEVPPDLLAACSQLQKELSTLKERRLLDHEDLAPELRQLTDAAAQREAELLRSLAERTEEARVLRCQLSDLLDQRLEEELLMTRTINTRLSADLEAAKRYIVVLAVCIQGLQDVICEGQEADPSSAFKLQMSRLEQENELLVSRLQAESESFRQQTSMLQEESSRVRGEVRALRSQLDQYHQVQTIKAVQEWNVWKEQYRVVSLTNEQLRRACLDNLQQILFRRTEQGELEGLRRIITLKDEELDSARVAATAGHSEVLDSLQDLRELLELPVHTSDKVTELDRALETLTQAATSLLSFQHSQTQRLQESCASLTEEIQAFHLKLSEIAEFSRSLLASIGPKDCDSTEKEYFAQSLEALKSMHEAEIDSFRAEVLQMEEQYLAERKRACDLARRLLDSAQFRPTLNEEAARHQQWETALLDELLQLLGPEPSGTIEEANESSEASDLSR